VGVLTQYFQWYIYWQVLPVMCPIQTLVYVVSPAEKLVSEIERLSMYFWSFSHAAFETED
jgi:hypothetical protein